jgi:hypothetical protein
MSILGDADKLISDGDKQAEYGSPLESFSLIAELWSIILDHHVTPDDVLLCLIQLKVARAVKHGAKYHRDTYLDIAGYAGCAELIADERATVAELPKEWTSKTVHQIWGKDHDEVWVRGDE